MAKVLVAEDSKTIQTVCEWMFKGSGHTVIAADAGDDTLRLVNEQQPQLLVLDYTLPDMDAYELCRTIKSSPSTASVAVLMMGGGFASFDEGKAQAVGADATINKPFRSDDFITKAQDLIAAATAGNVRSLAQAAPPPPAPAPTPEPEPAEAEAQASRFQFPGRPAPPAPQAAPQKRFTFPGSQGQGAPAAPSQPPPAPARGSGLNPAQPYGQRAPSQPAQAPVQQTQSAPTPQSPLPSIGPRAVAAAAPPAPAIDEAFLRAEVQSAVKELLPGIVRAVLRELLTKEVAPQLQRWVDSSVKKHLGQS